MRHQEIVTFLISYQHQLKDGVHMQKYFKSIVNTYKGDITDTMFENDDFFSFLNNFFHLIFDKII